MIAYRLSFNGSGVLTKASSTLSLSTMSKKKTMIMIKRVHIEGSLSHEPRYPLLRPVGALRRRTSDFRVHIIHALKGLS